MEPVVYGKIEFARFYRFNDAEGNDELHLLWKFRNSLPCQPMIPVITRSIPDPTIASVLFAVTIVTTIVGIFVSVYFMFIDPGFAYRVAAAVLVGIAGY